MLSGTDAGQGADGLDLTGNDVSVLGLFIDGFSGDGINVASSDDRLQDLGVGLSPSLDSARANGVGIYITGADNLIGTDGQDGSFQDGVEINVILGNLGPGIWVSGSGATGNVIAGDWTCCLADGQAFPNEQAGLLIDDGASNNWVGVNTVYGPESADEADHFTSNGGPGIQISGAGTTGNVVAGNTITANGSDGALFNDGASGNWVGVSPMGGPQNALEGNVISGNAHAGVEISGSGTTSNTIAGNYIGTDVTGTIAMANNFGVDIDQGAASNLIGTSGEDGSADDALERNVISGNIYEGVLISGSGSDQNAVAGNYIGTTADGQSALGNGSQLYIVDSFDAGIGGGVAIVNGAADNLVGTSGQSADGAAQGNLISGNLADGVDIYGAGTSGNVVAGNLIGTTAGDAAPLGNAGDGVYFAEAPGTNWIGVNPVYGSENADEGNVIDDNGSGSQIFDSTDEVFAGNLIEGNSPGSNGFGLQIVDSSNILIGTSGQDGAFDALERNVISGNAGTESGSTRTRTAHLRIPSRRTTSSPAT